MASYLDFATMYIWRIIEAFPLPLSGSNDSQNYEWKKNKHRRNRKNQGKKLQTSILVSWFFLET